LKKFVRQVGQLPRIMNKIVVTNTELYETKCTHHYEGTGCQQMTLLIMIQIKEALFIKHSY